jgi:phage tail sheath gpL-like
VLVIGEMLATGGAAVASTVYGPDTSVPCQAESDVTTLFGAGSELHRAFLRFTAVNQSTALYFCPVADPAGTAASGTISFTTTSTAVGNCTVWVGDQSVSFTIPSGSTVTATALLAVTAINANYGARWPVTASASVGVVTLTALNTGPNGNGIKIGAVITGTGVGTTVAPTAPTVLASGATADSYTAALAAIISVRYYNILVCDSAAAQVGAVCSQVNTQALPLNGIRGRVFCGFGLGLASGITFATGLNDPRCEIALTNGTDITPLECAANNCALFTLLEAQENPRLNYSMYPTNPTDAASWKLVASRSGPSAGLTPTQITSALNNGLTPYAVLPSGQLQLVKRITSYSLNGSVQDTRTRDACKVFVEDLFCDDLQTLISQQFGGCALIDNPPPGAPIPQGKVVWPRLVGDAIDQLITQYAGASLFQNLAAILAGTIVQRSPVNRDRIEAMVPSQVVDICDQFALVVNQVG